MKTGAGRDGAQGVRILIVLHIEIGSFGHQWTKLGQTGRYSRLCDNEMLFSIANCREQVTAQQDTTQNPQNSVPWNTVKAAHKTRYAAQPTHKKPTVVPPCMSCPVLLSRHVVLGPAADNQRAIAASVRSAVECVAKSPPNGACRPTITLRPSPRQIVQAMKDTARGYPIPATSVASGHAPTSIPSAGPRSA